MVQFGGTGAPPVNTRKMRVPRRSMRPLKARGSRPSVSPHTAQQNYFATSTHGKALLSK